jgi:hypothetical protein
MTKTTTLHSNHFILTALMLAILASLFLAAVRPVAADSDSYLNIVFRGKRPKRHHPRGRNARQ